MKYIDIQGYLLSLFWALQVGCHCGCRLSWGRAAMLWSVVEDTLSPTWMHKFPTNVGATSKLYVLEWWHNASSMLMTNKYHCSKFSVVRNLVLRMCAHLLQCIPYPFWGGTYFANQNQIALLICENLGRGVVEWGVCSLGMCYSVGR